MLNIDIFRYKCSCDRFTRQNNIFSFNCFARIPYSSLLLLEKSGVHSSSGASLVSPTIKPVQSNEDSNGRNTSQENLHSHLYSLELLHQNLLNTFLLRLFLYLRTPESLVSVMNPLSPRTMAICMEFPNKYTEVSKVQ